MMLTAAQTARRHWFWKCILIVLMPLLMISLGPFLCWASVLAYWYQRRVVCMVKNWEQVIGTIIDRREGDASGDAIDYTYRMNNTMYKGTTNTSDQSERIHLLVDPFQHGRCYPVADVKHYKQDTRPGVLFAYVLFALVGVLVTMLIAFVFLLLARSFAQFTSQDFAPPPYFKFLGYMAAIGNLAVACAVCWVREDMIKIPESELFVEGSA